MYNTIVSSLIAMQVVKRISLTRYHNTFLRRQVAIEAPYTNDLTLYLTKQGKRILKALRPLKTHLKADDPIANLFEMWPAETSMLIEISIDPIEKSLIEGSVLASTQVGGTPMWQNEIADALFSRRNRIVDVSNRLYNQMRMEIYDGITAGEGPAKIGKRIQALYGNDMSKFRAERIARTETSSAMSQASFETYKKNGVELKIWLATNDGRARASHLANAAQGPIPMKDAFEGTGEQYPGQSQINCRCAVSAYIT